MPSKVAANSLSITIIISIVLAILCSTLLFLSFYNKRLEIQLSIDEKIDDNLQSGIALALSDTSSNKQERNFSVDLFEKGNDSVSIDLKSWGYIMSQSLKPNIVTQIKHAGYFMELHFRNISIAAFTLLIMINHYTLLATQN